jgi:hypothetical protein
MMLWLRALDSLDLTPGNYGAGLTRPGYGPQAVGLDDMVRRLAELPLAAEPRTDWRYDVDVVIRCTAV